MGELLDRAFQRQLLTELRDVYPHAADVARSWGAQSDNRLLVNLSYLSEYSLVHLVSKDMMDGTIKMHTAKITARGLDFLANDGGLGAILGVVTVKLHEDTIRSLLIGKVEASGADPTVKASLIAKIKELPAEGLSALVQKALDAGLESLPNLAGWLQSAIAGG